MSSRTSFQCISTLKYVQHLWRHVLNHVQSTLISLLASPKIREQGFSDKWHDFIQAGMNMEVQPKPTLVYLEVKFMWCTSKLTTQSCYDNSPPPLDHFYPILQTLWLLSNALLFTWLLTAQGMTGDFLNESYLLEDVVFLNRQFICRVGHERSALQPEVKNKLMFAVWEFRWTKMWLAIGIHTAAVLKSNAGTVACCLLLEHICIHQYYAFTFKSKTQYQDISY